MHRRAVAALGEQILAHTRFDDRYQSVGSAFCHQWRRHDQFTRAICWRSWRIAVRPFGSLFIPAGYSLCTLKNKLDLRHSQQFALILPRLNGTRPVLTSDIWLTWRICVKYWAHEVVKQYGCSFTIRSGLFDFPVSGSKKNNSEDQTPRVS